MSDTISIDIPGAWHAFFEGTGVIQDKGDLTKVGYAGGPAVYKAYSEAEKIKRGKGYSLRLTFPLTEAKDALDCLWEYADVCVMVTKENLSDAFGVERFEILGENTAAKRVMERCDKLLAELKKQPVDGYPVAQADCTHGGFDSSSGVRRCLYCGKTAVQ